MAGWLALASGVRSSLGLGCYKRTGRTPLCCCMVTAWLRDLISIFNGYLLTLYSLVLVLMGSHIGCKRKSFLGYEFSVIKRSCGFCFFLSFFF